MPGTWLWAFSRARSCTAPGARNRAPVPRSSPRPKMHHTAGLVPVKVSGQGSGRQELWARGGQHGGGARGAHTGSNEAVYSGFLARSPAQPPGITPRPGRRLACCGLQSTRRPSCSSPLDPRRTVPKEGLLTSASAESAATAMLLLLLAVHKNASPTLVHYLPTGVTGLHMVAAASAACRRRRCLLLKAGTGLAQTFFFSCYVVAARNRGRGGTLSFLCDAAMSKA